MAAPYVRTDARFPELSKERAHVLEALMSLPLGASLKQVAHQAGKHVNTVEHHVKGLRKSGHLQKVKRDGWRKRTVWVPSRVRLTDHERAWLKLGPITARAIIVVAKGGGKRVASSEVAKALGWSQAVARYHLQRAREAGIVEGRTQAGYILTCTCDRTREAAGLNPRALEAVQYIANEGRRVSAREIARAFGWTRRCAMYHLGRAIKAGLLNEPTTGRFGGYSLAPNAALINWRKSQDATA